jgi:hypothetical protein
MLEAMNGYPDRFIDRETGKIVELKRWRPWESSFRFERIDFTNVMVHEIVIKSISISAVTMPKPLELQQSVTVKLEKSELLSMPLFSVLFVPPAVHGVELVQASLASINTRVTVEMSERPVEGHGLRLHLKGYTR